MSLDSFNSMKTRAVAAGALEAVAARLSALFHEALVSLGLGGADASDQTSSSSPFLL